MSAVSEYRSTERDIGERRSERLSSAPVQERAKSGAGKQRGASRKRIEDLAQPKQPRTVWIRTLGLDGEGYIWKRIFWGDQESLWPLSRAALSANATPRLQQLSEPKRNFQESDSNPEFLYSCGRQSVIWKVPPGATSAEPTERLQTLSQPKNVNAGFLEDRPVRKTKAATKPRQSPQARPDTRQGGQRSGRTSHNASPAQQPLPPITEGS